MEKYFWECGMGVINLDLIENPMVIKNIFVKGSIIQKCKFTL